jgi:hypothetical protein
LESSGKKFRKLVAESNPLQIVGTVNAYSAILAEKVGHQSIYLSGGGVAASLLEFLILVLLRYQMYSKMQSELHRQLHYHY